MEVIQEKKEEHLNEDGKHTKPWGTWNHLILLGHCWMMVLWRKKALCGIAVPNRGSTTQKRTYSSFIHVQLNNLWASMSWLKPRQIRSLLHLYKRNTKKVSLASFLNIRWNKNSNKGNYHTIAAFWEQTNAVLLCFPKK